MYRNHMEQYMTSDEHNSNEQAERLYVMMHQGIKHQSEDKI
jgi:hypothetical protein